MRAAVLLLVAGVLRHQVWEHVAPDQQARVWNMLGAVAIIVLLWMVVRAEKSALASIVAFWWAYEETLVAGCSGWHLLDPWIVGPGQELCSSRVGFKLGSITLLALGWISATLLDRMRQNERERMG